MRSVIAITLLAAASAYAAPLVARADGGSAYTGNAGQAVGGTNTETNTNAHGQGGIADNADVLNAFSGNAGDGGKAKSGDAYGGQGSTSWVWSNGQWVPVNGKGGDAYTGLGGNANGGNKGEYNYNYAKRCMGGYCGPMGGPYGYGYRGDGNGIADNLKLGNIATNNAGDGGDASSGNAYGGSAGGAFPGGGYIH